MPKWNQKVHQQVLSWLIPLEICFACDVSYIFVLFWCLIWNSWMCRVLGLLLELYHAILQIFKIKRETTYRYMISLHYPTRFSLISILNAIVLLSFNLSWHHVLFSWGFMTILCVMPPPLFIEWHLIIFDVERQKELYQSREISSAPNNSAHLA